MALPPHAQEWMNRAEIDYIGPFVKSWAAFNAWYRQASGKTKEREMLHFVIRDNNSRLRRRVLPLFEGGNGTAEAKRLKQAICDLQLQLDAIQWEVTPKGNVERVSLREVCIGPRYLQHEKIDRNGQRFTTSRIQGGHIEITVTSLNTGIVKFQFVQERYEPASVYAQPAFSENLSTAQQTRLREFYDGCNPRPMVDLVQGSGPRLQLSAMHFQCTNEDLLAGLVETLYSMRNALLHGEVDPDEQVLACYEPAYRIIMCFLEAIR
jgi:hypothetical protein